MGPEELVFVRETFDLSQRDLAKALNVSPYTVARWEAGDNEPTGLQDEVLRALHNTALRSRHDQAAARALGGMIALGIGALIFYLLTRAEEPDRAASSQRTSTSGRPRKR